MLEKRVQIALEAHLRFHFLHFTFDARHFLPTGLVDFLRRFVGRCPVTRKIGVHFLSLRQRADACRSTGFG